MTKRSAATIILLALITTSQATDKKDEGRYGAEPLKGDYYVYGGSLGDSTPPTKKDRKISFMLTGPLAKDLFTQIGPDIKKDAACSSDSDYRERRKGDLDCIFTKEDGYACHFGLDVRSGKSIHGSIC